LTAAYIKSPSDKNKLLIDDEAARIVRNIFKWRLEGFTCPNIAQRLNDMNVLTPNNYKFAKGIVSATRYSKRVLWYSERVKNILGNATYTGNTINGKTRTLQHQGYKIENLSENDWVVVQGTHEAIVAKEDFETVRRMSDDSKSKWHSQRANIKRAEYPEQENIFAGILFCTECGNKIKRYKRLDSGKQILRNSYYCRYCKDTLPKELKPKSFSQMKLEISVSVAINKYIEAFSDSQSIISRAKTIDEIASKRDSVASELTGFKRKLSQLNNRLRTLYANYQDEVLTYDDYQYLKQRYDSDKSDCASRTEELEVLLLQYEQETIMENKWMDAIERLKNHPLNRDIVSSLIERIEITHDHKLHITYKFRDPLDDNTLNDKGITL
jgi:hypothetical protein